MNGSASGMDDLSLGELLVRQGFVTFTQVHECLLLQKQRLMEGKSARLGEILVESGYVRAEQLQLVLDLQTKGRSAMRVIIPGYEILEKIGHGAMGAVYKARQLSVDRLVAIKVLPSQFSSDPQFVERFLREARSVARLSHPNIVAGFDAGEVGGLHYYVMEFVDGTTSQALLRARGRVPEAECIRIGRAIAHALEHASHHGIVHRDIKPQNIMIGREGTVKLCDLGLAKRMGADPALTADGIAVGTPYYISPELARGEHTVDVRSDIYSLGATLYHLATGQTPFKAHSYAAILAKHVGEPAPSPRLLVPELSEEFSRIVLKCLAKKKEDRYATPALLAADLEAHLGGPALSPLPGPRATQRRLGSTERRLSPHGHTRVLPPPARSSTPMFAIIGLILLAAGALSLLATMGGPSSTRRPAPPPVALDPSPEVPPTADDFDQRMEEYRKLRSDGPMRKAYEHLFRNLVASTGTTRRAEWEQERIRFEQDMNERIVRLYWGPIAERVKNLQSQDKLGAALDTVRTLADDHRYFLKTDRDQRLTLAGEQAKALEESIRAQIDAFTLPLIESFHKALLSRDFDKALAETDRLVPLAFDEPRQQQIEEFRAQVLAEVANDALLPPLKPHDIARAKERIVSLFERYRTNPKVASKIDPQLARLDETYAEELSQSGKALEESYAALFENAFDACMIQRRYGDIKVLAVRLLSDPRNADVQTALYLPNFDYDLLFRWLRDRKPPPPVDASMILRRLDEGRAVANSRPGHRGLGRFFGDLRALVLVEGLVERAASALSSGSVPEAKGLRHADLIRANELQRLPIEAPDRLCVFRARLSTGAEKEIFLAPAQEDGVDAIDLVALARRGPGAIDQTFELQAALTHLFCKPPHEKEMRQCLGQVTDFGLKSGWDQYERRLKAFASPAPPSASIQDLFRGKVTTLDAKTHRVQIAYEFKNPKEIEDFDPLRGRILGCKFAQSHVTGGMTIEGTGATYWKGATRGPIVLDISLIPNSQNKNLLILAGSASRQSGLGLFLDCTLGAIEPSKGEKSDHHAALVRLPLSDRDPLHPATRVSALECLPLVMGKAFKVRIVLTEKSMLASVAGVRGSSSVDFRNDSIAAEPGTFALWTWGSEFKITALTVETSLDDKWVQDRLSK